jgi:hypothetical protein
MIDEVPISVRGVPRFGAAAVTLGLVWCGLPIPRDQNLAGVDRHGRPRTAIHLMA